MRYTYRVVLMVAPILVYVIISVRVPAAFTEGRSDPDVTVLVMSRTVSIMVIMVAVRVDEVSPACDIRDTPSSYDSQPYRKGVSAT